MLFLAIYLDASFKKTTKKKHRKSDVSILNIELYYFVTCYYSNRTNFVSKYLYLSLFNVNAVIFNYKGIKKIFARNNLRLV